MTSPFITFSIQSESIMDQPFWTFEQSAPITTQGLPVFRMSSVIGSHEWDFPATSNQLLGPSGSHSTSEGIVGLASGKLRVNRLEICMNFGRFRSRTLAKATFTRKRWGTFRAFGTLYQFARSASGFETHTLSPDECRVSVPYV